MFGDGFEIPAGAGDFDRIIVTAAMEQIPEALTQRLEPGGILIAPVGPHQGTQTLVRMTRTEAGFERKALVDVRLCRRCRELPANCKTPDWLIRANPYSEG